MKKFKRVLKFLGLVAMYATPREHDRAMARSQALVHLVGRSLQSLRLQPQDISTPDYESLLSMQEMVRHDSWQLFYDMQNYNPYASSIRKKVVNKMIALEHNIRSHSIHKEKLNSLP